MKKLVALLLIAFLAFGGYFTYMVITAEKRVSSESDPLDNKNSVKLYSQENNAEKENTHNSKQRDVKKIEKYVQWTIRVADNNVHGYSQGFENATYNHPYTGSREGPDYDCASLVYHALDYAGFPIIAAWKQNPAYYNLYQGKQATGDADTIWTDLQKVGGFARYSWDEVKDDLHRGDILCNPEVHVAVYIGDGKTVEARGVNNPRGGSWRTGDQGGEIDFYNAYGRGWTEVYRYIE